MKQKRLNTAMNAKEKFNELITPNINRLHKMLCAYMGSFESAQDVLQESLIKAYGHIHSLQETEKAYAWLYTIARNEAKRYFFKHPKESEMTENVALKADESFGRAEQKQDIAKLLLGLEREDREIIILKDMFDYSYAEIADMLELSVSNVGVRLSRARDRFRKIMNESGYWEGERDSEMR